MTRGPTPLTSARLEIEGYFSSGEASDYYERPSTEGCKLIIGYTKSFLVPKTRTKTSQRLLILLLPNSSPSLLSAIERSNVFLLLLVRRRQTSANACESRQALMV
jgi:hypothetical protein